MDKKIIRIISLVILLVAILHTMCFADLIDIDPEFSKRSDEIEIDINNNVISYKFNNGITLDELNDAVHPKKENNLSIITLVPIIIFTAVIIFLIFKEKRSNINNSYKE